MDIKKGDKIIVTEAYRDLKIGDEVEIEDIGKDGYIGARRGCSYYALSKRQYKLKEELKEERPLTTGDWVEITKSSNNWASEMDQYVGWKVQLGGKSGRGFMIPAIGKWTWVEECGHFKRTSAPYMYGEVTSKETNVEKAKRLYPVGTVFVAPDNGETYTVAKEESLVNYSEHPGHGILVMTKEEFRQYVYYEAGGRNQWAEIKPSVTVHEPKTSSMEELLEEAKRRFPAGTVFNNKNLKSWVQNNYTSKGELKIANSRYIVCNTESGNFTIYEDGKWAEIIQKAYAEPSMPMDLLAEAKRRYPIGTRVRCLRDTETEGRGAETIIADNWQFYGTSNQLVSMPSLSAFVYYHGKWAAVVGTDSSERERPTTWTVKREESSIEKMPREVVLERKREKRRELV